MRKKYDIAIVGSGFSGSLLSMIARRLGRSVVLLERGTHPRVVIGESSTPLTNLLLEELTIRYDLPRLRPLTKWGSWQKTYPEIACGLKRGFTFYHHSLEKPRNGHPDRDSELLVAASPNNSIADTHWYRADLDYFLVREAQEMEVDYLDETDLSGITQSETELTLDGMRKGERVSISADFLVDASGPRGFLHRVLNLEEAPLPGFPPTQALYSHFTGVGHLQHSRPIADSQVPPYPIDAAAVHHIFDGGWIWVLKFNNGVTSAGVAATNSLAGQLGLDDGEVAWQRILRRIPVLQDQFCDAKPQRPFSRINRLSFRSASIAGERWALLPSAAGFVDPLLSTGFPLALLGVGRLAEIIEQRWDSTTFSNGLQAYSAQTEGDLLAAGQLIGALYASMKDFKLFSSLSLLYFAAVSFSEAARRLGKSHLASSFMLREDPAFGPDCERLLCDVLEGLSLAKSPAIVTQVLRIIEPFNLAGFGEPGLRNWYPVDAQDLFRGREKLHASQAEISDLLSRCGFRP